MDIIPEGNTEERKIIKYGYRWMGLIPLILSAFIILDLLTNYENIFEHLTALLICAVFFFIFKISRRIQYDSNNLYIIRGGNERVIPFSTIISIKKSSTKVNGSRYWKLLYKDNTGNEKMCRYFLSFAKEFNESVRKVNPDVVIWTHPFFNH